jgi:thymidylate synthase
MTTYADVESAFLGELRHIVQDGTEISVRGHLTREVRARVVEVTNVRERYIVVDGRHNNVFASIAESMWVIAGRNDLGYLRAYLPRAHEFSDDGATWRAGYGPRLRSWNGVDQLAELVKLLTEEAYSRRAVATLFDPERDFVDSKDIPCNNWLHFMVRDGAVDLHIAARSTDIWWGFSGINAFEWTLLLEMMAFWLGYAPGRLVFFSSSMHLYERHFSRATRVLDKATPRVRSGAGLSFATPWRAFHGEMAEWMRVEQAMRSGTSLARAQCELTDPLMIAYAKMIDVFWAFERREPQASLDARLAALGDARLVDAAREFIEREANSTAHSA